MAWFFSSYPCFRVFVGLDCMKINMRLSWVFDQINVFMSQDDRMSYVRVFAHCLWKNPNRVLPLWQLHGNWRWLGENGRQGPPLILYFKRFYHLNHTFTRVLNHCIYRASAISRVRKKQLVSYPGPAAGNASLYMLDAQVWPWQWLVLLVLSCRTWLSNMNVCCQIEIRWGPLLDTVPLGSLKINMEPKQNPIEKDI